MTKMSDREREIKRTRRPRRQCGYTGCDEPPTHIVRVDDPRPDGIVDRAIAACRIHAEIARRNDPNARVKPL